MGKISGYLPHTCKICGEWEDNEFMDDVAKRLHEQALCHTCNFWLEKVEWRDNDRVVRYERDDGTRHHMMIGAEDALGMRGFSGQRWVVHFLDGREVVSTNMWYQGEIPERWWDQLPVNAVVE